MQEIPNILPLIIPTGHNAITILKRNNPLINVYDLLTNRISNTMWPLWRGHFGDQGCFYWPLALSKDGRYEEVSISVNVWIVGRDEKSWPLSRGGRQRGSTVVHMVLKFLTYVNVFGPSEKTGERSFFGFHCEENFLLKGNFDEMNEISRKFQNYLKMSKTARFLQFRYSPGASCIKLLTTI